MVKEILVPDTSVIIDGRVVPLTEKHKDVRVSIPEAVVAELGAVAQEEGPAHGTGVEEAAEKDGGDAGLACAGGE